MHDGVPGFGRGPFRFAASHPERGGSEILQEAQIVSVRVGR